MEFVDPNQAQTKNDIAQLFSATIYRLLTYLIKYIPDASCAEFAKDMRNKYTFARDTLLSYEEITESVGAVIATWRTQIIAYDSEFFERTDITQLFPANVVKHLRTNQSGVDFNEMRAKFYRVLDENMRVTVLNALNLLLVLYARYVSAAR